MRHHPQYGNLSPKYILISVNYRHFSALFNNLRKSKSLLSFLLLFMDAFLLPCCSEIVRKAVKRVAWIWAWLSSIMAVLPAGCHFFQMLVSAGLGISLRAILSSWRMSCVTSQQVLNAAKPSLHFKRGFFFLMHFLRNKLGMGFLYTRNRAMNSELQL